MNPQRYGDFFINNVYVNKQIEKTFPQMFLVLKNILRLPHPTETGKMKNKKIYFKNCLA